MKIYVVGLGPGDAKQMTPRAKAAIEKSSVIVGYNAYIELLGEEILEGKNVISTGMMKEIDRCRAAVEYAQQGNAVAVVCSGDAGVYGMATLVLELCDGHGVEVKVIPGITAACSGAAVLGAPLSHDFCVISLSDLLTEQELIDKRIHAAGMGDFCIAIYNPMSKRRTDKLKNACDILLQYKSPQTVCGYVKNIGREGEQGHILTLAQLRDAKVDMFTTVFVGNCKTKIMSGRMVTPRGYEKKSEF